MASMMGDDVDSVYEGQRQSLLDVIEERNRALNKKSLLHRITIVSRLYPDRNFQDINQHYEKYFKDLEKYFQVEPVTGLLLLYPKHCVHVIETSQDIISEVLRTLRREAKSGEGNMELSKVLAVSHDIPHRLYQTWNCRGMNIEAHIADDYEPSDQAPSMVVETLTQLLKLGSYINRQPKTSMKNIMESLHDKVPELLPPQDTIGYLTEADNPCVYTLREYLNIYEKPYDVTLDSELTWPMPVRLFPYN